MLRRRANVQNHFPNPRVCACPRFLSACVCVYPYVCVCVCVAELRKASRSQGAVHGGKKQPKKKENACFFLSNSLTGFCFSASWKMKSSISHSHWRGTMLLIGLQIYIQPICVYCSSTALSHVCASVCLCVCGCVSSAGHRMCWKLRFTAEIKRGRRLRVSVAASFDRRGRTRPIFLNKHTLIQRHTKRVVNVDDNTTGKLFCQLIVSIQLKVGFGCLTEKTIKSRVLSKSVLKSQPQPTNQRWRPQHFFLFFSFF